MADKKVSAFTATLAVDGTETFPVLQGGVNKIVLLSAVKTSYTDLIIRHGNINITRIG